MLFDPRNPNQLVNVRNESIPDVFPISVHDVEYYVHISPYVWLRPWEGKEHTGFSIGLAAGCPSACRAFGQLNKGYLDCSLEDIVTAAKERIHALGKSYFTSKSAGVSSLADLAGKGYTVIDEAESHRHAYDKGYRFVAHIYQLRGGGMRRHMCDWYFYGRPQSDTLLTRLRQDESLHPDAMHYELNELIKELSVSA